MSQREQLRVIFEDVRPHGDAYCEALFRNVSRDGKDMVIAMHSIAGLVLMPLLGRQLDITWAPPVDTGDPATLWLRDVTSGVVVQLPFDPADNPPEGVPCRARQKPPAGVSSVVTPAPERQMTIFDLAAQDEARTVVAAAEGEQMSLEQMQAELARLARFVKALWDSGTQSS